MDIKIRKKDSITSILLFIFNVFLTEKKVTELPLKKIFKIMEPFRKNETAIRMGLSRGVQNGLLVNVKKEQEVYYRLTNMAAQSLKHWGETMSAFLAGIPRQQSPWDGLWHIVYISGAGTDEIVHSLRQLGYGSLDKHLWLSPYGFAGEVAAIAGEKELNNSMYRFRGELVDNRGPEEIASEVWPVEELNRRYKHYALVFKDAVKTLCPGSCEGGAVLPFLHQLGLKLFEIMQDDPQLPLQLLPPDWCGIQSVQNFIKVRKQLLPKANAFITGIIEA